MKKYWLILIVFIHISHVFGQARPFPQNVDYAYGYKATVITAEQVENAYSRWKEAFLVPCDGMYRVAYSEEDITISEGMGYGMLLTAYFGEKEYFDGLFDFYLSKRTSNAYNLMGWRVTCDDILDPGSATDGDLDVAFALLVAYNQWGGTYLDDAVEILTILEEHYFIQCDGVYTMKPGGQFGGCGLTDISYYTPGYFRLFAKAAGGDFWNIAADDSYVILENATNESTGLVPDWQSADGEPGGDPHSGRVDYYRYDACRVPWRIAWDYLWNGNETARDWCVKITNFANSIGPADIVDGYELDGRPLGQYNNSAFVGGFAAGAMCNSQEIVNSFASRLIYLDGAGWDNQYFNFSLRCLYMLALTGNFWRPDITPNTFVEKSLLTPSRKDLMNNYPNPFNPITSITYDVSEKSRVRITIFDLQGREVRTILNEQRSPGRYTQFWDGTDRKGHEVTGGVYFLRIQAGDLTETRKMTLVK